eukprot:CAMPEP_0168344790 /NCGR_PEP_ID=MMETSP0213-20121227/17073_1 /TAXON_ID=151035 /ORGANISM="Euplotes harpa, Strain FSP1.4" /LENGTH=219 /DNA_ID=CAMNT_0008352693 /DNA_START=1 /DNA_END=660 /DNA_ORIENTATION=+
MVYKIRNKGFVNWGGATSPRVFVARKTKSNLEVGRHVTLQVHMTRYSGMRIFHNYRRISRAWKQFMMGDKMYEQMSILILKQHFSRPFTYDAPIENAPYLGRTFSDLWDRHYSLFATNQHPLQLVNHEKYNEFLRKLHDKDFAERNLEIIEKVKEIKKQKEAALDTKEGETLSVDDIAEIYYQVMAEYRNKHGFAGKARRNGDEYADYLEVRRPFGAGQ